MPTPRQHGGAALQHIPLNLPAFKGLNKQARGAVLGPEWATVLENSVLDDNNRVAARKGWATTNTTPAAQDFVQLVEYDNVGVKEIIASGDTNAMYKSTDDGATWTVVTGTATVTDPNMQFVLFNGILLGLQNAGGIIQYTGTTFSNLAAASEPTGGTGLAAFGRLWVKDTATTLQYCALLDETDWTGTDAGTFDLTSVWQEQDEITAITQFNSALVIFSKRNIVIYTDGSGSVLGLDPVTAYVADTIGGMGCIARDSVVSMKGDLWFLDQTGIHSLGRLIQERSNPLQNVSRNVQDELVTQVERILDKDDIRAVYSPGDRFYLLSLPLGSGSTENGVVFVFDTRASLEDGSFRCTGIWNGMVPTAMIVREDFSIISTLRNTQGEVGTYTGNTDDGAPYILDYESGWTDLGDPSLKFIKRIAGVFVIDSDTTVIFKWGYDFQRSLDNTASTIFAGFGTPDEWGLDEWNIAEWGGGDAIDEKRVAGKGSGEYIKIGFTTSILGAAVAVQQLALYAKLGRLK